MPRSGLREPIRESARSECQASPKHSKPARRRAKPPRPLSGETATYALAYLLSAACSGRGGRGALDLFAGRLSVSVRPPWRAERSQSREAAATELQRRARGYNDR